MLTTIFNLISNMNQQDHEQSKWMWMLNKEGNKILWFYKDINSMWYEFIQMTDNFIHQSNHQTWTSNKLKGLCIINNKQKQLNIHGNWIWESIWIFDSKLIYNSNNYNFLMKSLMFPRVIKQYKRWWKLYNL